MQAFVAYYRVSTGKQGASGLGLEAQREAVARHVTGRGELAAEFTEIESGKRSDRPELTKALALCRRKRAALIIAKLDRLARNVAFVSRVLESGAEIVCCDMPSANRLMLHMVAAFAEYEREQVSARTKAALARAKARGVRLGCPTPRPELATRAARAKAAAFRATVLPPLLDMQARGFTMREMAGAMNAHGIPTSRCGQWHPSTVYYLLKAQEDDRA